MKVTLKDTLINIAAFFLTIIILFGFLYLSALIPNEAIRENMTESAKYYIDSSAYVRALPEFENSKGDNYADVILHGISWNMGVGDPIRAIFDTKYNDGDTGAVLERAKYGFYSTVIGGAEPDTDYTRYPHGTAAFIRIFHLFTNAKGVKLIGFSAILAAIAATCLCLFKKKHGPVAIMLVLSLASVQAWYLCLSIEFQPTFLICFLLCPLYLWLEGKGDRWLIVLSVIGGALVAFFDFLTTETVALLIPLLLVVAVRAREGRLGDVKGGLFAVISNGISFLFSYAATFLVKWGIASLVTGDNKFEEAISAAADRAVGVEFIGSQVENPILQIIYAPMANLTVMLGGDRRVETGRVIICLLIVVLLVVAAFYILPRKKYDKAAIASFILIGAIPILRFIVLNRHSYYHGFFTYRALTISILALLLSLSLCLGLKPEKNKEISKKKRKRV